MPEPHKNEDKDTFISRCMSDEEAKADFPKTDQRYAFCLSKFKEKDKKKD